MRARRATRTRSSKESGLFSRATKRARSTTGFGAASCFRFATTRARSIAFSGRVLSAEQSPAKYVNSPETPLFTKGAVLFGLHKSKRALIDKKQAIVCEGQIDLITAFEHGVQNVIAPQGTAFTERQARILKRYAEEVVLCFDADAAGEKAAERSLPHLLGQGLAVRVAEMPQGEDPDSLIRKSGADAFRERVAAARDLFDYQTRRQAPTPEPARRAGKSPRRGSSRNSSLPARRHRARGCADERRDAPGGEPQDSASSS